MRHFASPEFWAAHERLTPALRTRAAAAFELLKSDPAHPSLRFKKVGPYWAARVGLDYRALAIKHGDDFYWFWIGPHDSYERLVRR